ncbi:MAG TPA: metal ABC transporter substrate-binding protein [Anaerolineae bacterium]|nr:metal ABC transporter substrate-binding protein [Anaerolineae bacterium]
MIRRLIVFLLITAALAACAAPTTPSSTSSLASTQAAPPTTAAASLKTIVVTYSVLGSVVKDLVGDKANVIVPMPNGQDVHDWEPSAKDIEAFMKADLVVQNGLGLEGGMEKALQQAQEAGVKFFTASDHIPVRKVGAGEGLPTGDPDQATGADDPHLWMDPVDMKLIVEALAAQIKTDLGIDLSDRAKDLEGRLDSLNQEIADQVNSLPQANRKLVTGHESMGYFAQRYGFKLVGALIPSLTTQGQVSASDLAALKELIQQNQVRAIYTELGTPAAVADAIGQETGVKVIPLVTHYLPEADSTYFTFLRGVATTIVDGLK